MPSNEVAAQTRQRIIESFVALIEECDEVTVSVTRIAEHANLSVRTVRKYFPSRDALLRATGEWLNTQVFGFALGTDEDDLVQGFRIAAERFDEHPNLSRILALTRVGRSMRIKFRNELLIRRRRTLWRDTPDVPAADRRRAEAVIACLDNILSWLTLKEEFDMNGSEAGAAISWAIEVILRETRAMASSDQSSQP
ncbi:TetR/AcrR family transcriptional regulator [Komagataeibacter sucrofermentans]|uniref:TetR family transcriptional regulator n=1 Tax=Komagataeibacter sucrofermentans TaxID=1053551 RepID=A0A318QXW8_9PROT|nr:TetR/AcrR family transcriptional regulator [Komagataeibacter sucrofermentans]PYD77813.1 TetR family transcriptional regulator [Komagataeibacter sucrofermentans]GBQ51637.1 TetR family transcriptional regulator [Komagataeibacter sucrofermentans DSM 15973]